MGLAPRDEEPLPPSEAGHSDVSLVEAGESPERRCADCGTRTLNWKPVRRQGTSIILCEPCAAKAATQTQDDGCPSCGAPLLQADRFCGKCGARLEYDCPSCGAVMDADDLFCGKCGTRVG